MGNQSSAQRPPAASAPSSSASAAASTNTSNPSSEAPTRSHSRRDSKHPIPVHSQRVVVPPEPSLAQAQGSTTPAARALHKPSQSQSSLPPQPIAVPSPSSSLSRTPEPSAASRPAQQPPLQPAPAATVAAFLDEPTRPVAVPIPSQNNHHHHRSLPSESPGDTGKRGAGSLETPDTASVMMATSSIQDISYLTRPPRLPLPIEEEIHTPGSPIISADDIPLGSPVGNVDALDSDETLNRKSSALSANTFMEDEPEDELRVDKTRPTVPFTLEWPGGGDKIYVTGTIFQWNRKHRLYPVEGKPGVFAATMNILPGTHHVRFLVDGQMQTSPDLPTTVDFGNNLVNYIEVKAVDATAGAPSADAAEKKGSQQDFSASRGGSLIDEKTIRYKEVDPIESFEYDIPQYLIDFDQPEESEPYHRSVNAIEKLPTPPSLPGFLGKPILNAAVLIKDDNSVLNMPNHTVLNHLATSSIKNNILAVSATTRYKSKYVTTIVYKPTSTDG
ncbi:hypothetical protein GGTG_06165 [Gaeumannomyces tritici R3-111a-1]|uniref:Association with the SNF1 complex (ASC) domain-containing protein n=1 Tax=Gaeumannomyces tritici (strain R3-111a-1) TaxID=644352 RepID=J3NY10_GAET3|nr:hypothetical protein GGTG_06165 [Gaeumannomyces tritici R3-111a-1]EJT76243.1 hypothetical protein GGTG_06165 [Gaeumannomyces tritici R3-111a-1]